VNDKDEIEEGFLHFEAGVRCEEVWRWFEATYPSFSVGDRQSGKRSEQPDVPA